MNRSARWIGLLATLLLFLLYLANVPFYAGSSLGSHYIWRMEHGRIALHRFPSAVDESFYIAMNSEGLRFRPEWRFSTFADWRFNLPLWVPLLIFAAACTLAWRNHLRNRPRRADRCRHCRYPRAGLEAHAPCPECGRPPRGRRASTPIPVRSNSPPL